MSGVDHISLSPPQAKKEMCHTYLLRPTPDTGLQLQSQSPTLAPRTAPIVNTSYTLNQFRRIYGFPPPPPTAAPVTVGVFSFGGGLIGTLTNGVLTNGDVQKQWSLLGIPAANHPRVLVVPVNRASITPNPTDGGATLENTIDVAMIGAMCPLPSLTIILYIANPWDNFPVLLTAAMNPITISGRAYTPSIISISWGAPEIYFDTVTLNSINATLQVAASRGITITAATGDRGSSNGTPYTTTDFPSSSPHVVACGGTTLNCPNGVYDGSTVEIGWPGSGGGFSRVFAKPAYQSSLPGTKRSTPDIALVADPNTGVQFVFNGRPGEVVGGTSIVSPAIAGFAAILNLKQALTPLLYTYPASTFYDILMGSNGAYVAKVGYDNCTGLGSINGANLLINLQAPAVNVTGVTLTGTISIAIGQSSQVVATIAPTSATNRAITFTSSNTAIDTVSSGGVVTGQVAGTVTITVITEDGGFTASMPITISPIAVSDVILTGSTTLAKGQTTQVTAVVYPPHATNKTVIFSSSNSAIATVSAAGIVTGISAGSVLITATTVDGRKLANLSLTVVNFPVTGVLLAGGGSIIIGRTLQLTTTVYPANALNKAVSYTSNNGAVATVSSSGLVTGVAAGTAIIAVTTADGAKTSTVQITVTQVKVTGVKLSTPNLQIRRRGIAKLIAIVNPSNAINKTVNWTSTNPRIATVSSSGSVLGLAAGRCQIIVSSVDGNFAAACTVTVS